MEHHERGSSILPLSALLIALGLGSYYLYEQPYQSLRPPEAAAAAQHPSSEDVDARLWEDPFEPLYGLPRMSACGGLETETRWRFSDEASGPRSASFELFRDVTSHQVRHLADDVYRRVETRGPSEGRLVLLPVLVPGGPYAELVEKRRRMRYAVIAGLGAAGYVPQVSDHIGYVESCWDLGRLDLESGRSIPVPYEWFRPDSLRSVVDRGEAHRVLVLWLDEGEMGPEPWRALDDLLRHLVGYCPAADVRKGACGHPSSVEERFAFALIGPSTSDFLARLVEEKERRESTGGGEGANDPRVLEESEAAGVLASCLSKRFGSPPGGSRPGCREPLDPGEPIPGTAPPPASEQRSCDGLCAELSEGLGRFLKLEGRTVSLGDRAGHLLRDLTDRVAKSPYRPPEWEDPTRIAEEVAFWVAENRNVLFGTIHAPSSVLPQLSAYSSRATVPAALLLSDHGRLDERYRTGSWDAELERRILEDIEIARFVSVIGRDDQLAVALVEELRRRGVDVCKPEGTNHVALVGEWDTFYGRALPLAIEAAILKCRGGDGAPPLGQILLDLLDGNTAPPERVDRFNYLRGLDGASPRPARRASGSGEDPAGGDSVQAADGGGSLRFRWPGSGTVERAVGNRQFDYMRRLASQLTARDRELGEAGQAIRAIGVVGSDVYDKLLVLQALRERFPQTLFFTTDLDSRLFHPEDYRWNRNLLVASSFGLSLRDDFQARIPPFRDGYQTATFLAVQLAIAGVDAPADGGADRFEPPPRRAQQNPRILPVAHRTAPTPGTEAEPAGDLPRRKKLLRLARQPWLDPVDPKPRPGPRVFEIGRTGPYDLTPEDEDWELHPARRSGRPDVRALRSAAGVSVLGLLLLVPVVPGLRRFTMGRWSEVDHRELFYVNVVTILVLLATVAYWGLVYVATRDGGGEPFELWEGISVWPTEGLRLVALLLALTFISLGAVRLKRNAEDIERRFGLEAGKRTRLPSMWSRWWSARAEGRTEGSPGWLLGFGDLAPLRMGGVVRHAAEPVLRARRDWWAWRKLISINAWKSEPGKDAEAYGARRTKKAEGSDVWDRYRYLGRLGHRLTRFVPVAFLYWLLAQALIQILGRPHVPYRGEMLLVVDRAILVASVLGVVGLTFFVVDATRLCERFIHVLTDRRTNWRPAVVQEAVAHWKVDPRDAADFLDLEIIADRTEAVGRLIVYPFAVLFLMIVSRASVFDNWDWPLSLLLILTMASCYALLCAVVLRRAAEEARRKVIERLRGNLFEAVREEDREDGPRASQIRLLIEEARRIHRGAFAHWSHHPVVRAVLLPFGGIGAVALIELLAALSR